MAAIDLSSWDNYEEQNYHHWLLRVTHKSTSNKAQVDDASKCPSVADNQTSRHASPRHCCS